MKKILLAFWGLCSVFSAAVTNAQNFTIAHDTVSANVVTIAAVVDPITNRTGSSLPVSWHVIATDFPSDWLTASAFGICDNNLCRGNSAGTLWNGSTGTTYNSTYYANTTHDSAANFSLSLDFTSATTLGTHWVTIQITDGTTTKTETFLINKLPASAASVPAVMGSETSVMLYPNPATNEINVVYDANVDVKNIAVYNIIGKLMTVYKVTGASANLNLENTPAGIYFARLVNANGQVVATRKFTKQ
jgi:hypothetical protein